MNTLPPAIMGFCRNGEVARPFTALRRDTLIDDAHAVFIAVGIGDPQLSLLLTKVQDADIEAGFRFEGRDDAGTEVICYLSLYNALIAERIGAIQGRGAWQGIT